jgi:MYXO-CTERM domain-containing protein
LGSGSGQSGTVTVGAALTVGGGTVAVTVTGNNATLTKLGTIKQTGAGRVIRDNTAGAALVLAGLGLLGLARRRRG